MKHLKQYNESVKHKVEVPAYVKRFMRDESILSDHMHDINISFSQMDGTPLPNGAEYKISSANNRTQNHSEFQKVFQKYEKELINAAYLDVLNMIKKPLKVEFIAYGDLKYQYGINDDKLDCIKEYFKVPKGIKVRTELFKLMTGILEEKGYLNMDEEMKENGISKIEYNELDNDGYYFAYEKTVKNLNELSKELEFLDHFVINPQIARSKKLVNINKKLGVFDTED